MTMRVCSVARWFWTQYDDNDDYVYEYECDYDDGRLIVMMMTMMMMVITMMSMMSLMLMMMTMMRSTYC
jgi:hypothetical protein